MWAARAAIGRVAHQWHCRGPCSPCLSSAGSTVTTPLGVLQVSARCSVRHLVTVGTSSSLSPELVNSAQAQALQRAVLKARTVSQLERLISGSGSSSVSPYSEADQVVLHTLVLARLAGLLHSGVPRDGERRADPFALAETAARALNDSLARHQHSISPTALPGKARPPSSSPASASPFEDHVVLSNLLFSAARIRGLAPPSPAAASAPHKRRQKHVTRSKDAGPADSTSSLQHTLDLLQAACLRHFLYLVQRKAVAAAAPSGAAAPDASASDAAQAAWCTSACRALTAAWRVRAPAEVCERLVGLAIGSAGEVADSGRAAGSGGGAAAARAAGGESSQPDGHELLLSRVASDLVLLLSALARPQPAGPSGVAAPVPEGALTRMVSETTTALLPLLPHASFQALTAAAEAIVRRSFGDGKSPRLPTTPAGSLLDDDPLAPAGGGGAAAGGGSLHLLCAPFLLAVSQEATLRLHAAAARVGGVGDGADDGDGEGHATAPSQQRQAPATATPARAGAIPATPLAILMDAYQLLGFRVPHLFAAAAAYLSAVSPLSGTSDSGSDRGAGSDGERSYRDIGTHPADGVASRAQARRAAAAVSVDDGAGHGGGGGGGGGRGEGAVVAVVSTYPSGAISSLAKSFAQCRYVEWEAPAVRRMWAAVAATAAHRLAMDVRHMLGAAAAAATAPSDTSAAAPPPLPQLLQALSIRPGDNARLAFCFSRASITAPAVLRLMLLHAHAAAQLRARQRPGTPLWSALLELFTPGALALLLWACALQGVFRADVVPAAFNAVVQSCDHGAVAAAGLQPNGAAGGHKELTQTMQRQLFAAALAASLEGDAELRARLAELLGTPEEPAPQLARWKRAFVATVPTTSKLQVSVGEALRAALRADAAEAASDAATDGDADVGGEATTGRPEQLPWRVQDECTLPCGLLVDFLITPQAGGSASERAKASSGQGGSPQRSRGIVVEVLGPTHFTRGRVLPSGASQGSLAGIMHALDDGADQAPAAQGGGAAARGAPATHRFSATSVSPVAERPQTASGAAAAPATQGIAFPLPAHAEDSGLATSLARFREGAETPLGRARLTAVPALTCATSAKLRWLRAAGYAVVTVSHLEWDAAAAGDEKAALLLEDKGLRQLLRRAADAARAAGGSNVS